MTQWNKYCLHLPNVGKEIMNYSAIPKLGAINRKKCKPLIVNALRFKQ